MRLVVCNGWCSYCIAAATALAGVRSSWPELPAPWLRAMPVCSRHLGLYPVTITDRQLAVATGAKVEWDRAAASRASRSLRRVYGAATAAG